MLFPFTSLLLTNTRKDFRYLITIHAFSCLLLRRILRDYTMSSDRSGSVGKQNGFSEVKGPESTSYDGISDPKDARNHGRKNSMDAMLAKQVIPPQMTTKVKGLLKGLRYISQIFEPPGKEPEMQIGYPTDVKHVAHIGWDGPSLNPTWMNEHQPTQYMSTTAQSTPAEAKEQRHSPAKRTSHGSRRHSSGDQEHSKSSRRHQTQDSSNDESEAPKVSRRNRQSAITAPNFSTGEASDMPRQSRQHREKSISGLDSSTKELSGAPNRSRRKKSSRSEGGSNKPSRSEGGSTRPSRSRAPSAANSDSDAKNTEEQPAATKSREEEEIQSA